MAFDLIVRIVATLCMCMAGTCSVPLRLKPSPERQFDKMMREWAENARTNTVAETSARFRDEVLVPFIRREMPNPFASGGAEANSPWADEASEVFEAGLRFICDDYWSVWVPDGRLGRRADGLVRQGCENPFILLLSAFSSDFDWLGETKDSGRRLARAREIADDMARGEFLRMLLCYYRHRAGVAEKDERPRDYFAAWMTARDFGSEDEIPLCALCAAFCGSSTSTVFDPFGKFKWAKAMNAANDAMNAAIAAAGGGIAAKVPPKAWTMLSRKASLANEWLDEAERVRPGRVETLRSRLWVEGEGRRGRREREDGIFMEISRKRLDDRDALVRYCWYRLHPRWGNAHGHREMLKFAEACWETGRHDTMLPYFYAETQCRYVRDANVDPFSYFSGNPEIAERCIDACMRQATNESACGHARITAPFVGAAAAYYAGRYEDMARFDPYVQLAASFQKEVNDIFPDVDSIYGNIGIFSCCNSNAFITLRRMFDRGQYAEALAGIDELRNGGALANGTENDKFWSARFAAELSLAIHMKTDFANGGDVMARIPLYLHGWWGPGWWRCSDRTIQTYRPFEWKSHFTWRAQLPKAHEIEFTLEPKPGTNGRHVLVLSRFVHEESHHLPINGIPFLTLIWEEGRTGAYFANDYYEMFNIDPGRAKWTGATEARRRVRVVCDGRRIKVYVGDACKPLRSTSRYRLALEKSPDVGYARFRGENVRVSDIVVRGVDMVGNDDVCAPPK